MPTVPGGEEDERSLANGGNGNLAAVAFQPRPEVELHTAESSRGLKFPIGQVRPTEEEKKFMGLRAEIWKNVVNESYKGVGQITRSIGPKLDLANWDKMIAEGPRSSRVERADYMEEKEAKNLSPLERANIRTAREAYFKGARVDTSSGLGKNFELWLERQTSNQPGLDENVPLPRPRRR